MDRKNRPERKEKSLFCSRVLARSIDNRFESAPAAGEKRDRSQGNEKGNQHLRSDINSIGDGCFPRQFSAWKRKKR